MDKARLKMGSVPVRIAARVYGRDPAWVRAGIIAGWLPIGEATRNGKRITDVQQMNSKLGRISYYISPKLLYEQTGYCLLYTSPVRSLMVWDAMRADCSR